MKFSPTINAGIFPKELSEILADLRNRRGFNAQTCTLAKCMRINAYFATHGLCSAVVGVSGGIDSAVALGLLVRASKQPGSPIKHIVPVLMPVHNERAASNQTGATIRGEKLVESYGLDPICYDLTGAHCVLRGVVDAANTTRGSAWASGQLASYIRTPALYYTTSLLTDAGKPGIVCGTTNRDEGAYLGFVGKASDAVVDVQVISDLHKSEVYALANELDVTQSIIDAVPTGDMFDGRVDEEVFGAPYDFVELYLLMRSMCTEVEYEQMIQNLSGTARRVFGEYAKNIEALHTHNKHKYLGGWPGVHLDVMDRGVPGGWGVPGEQVSPDPGDVSVFINPFSFSRPIPFTRARHSQVICTRSDTRFGSVAQILDGVLGAPECTWLTDQAHAHGYVPAAINGYAKTYKKGDSIGSYRASVFSPELAHILWQRIRACVNAPSLFTGRRSIDADGCCIWKPIGVSPLMRFIRYKESGQLIPHYDAPYVYNDRQRTLMSLVLYLSYEDVVGGETRFIQDPNETYLVHGTSLSFTDWNRIARPDEIKKEFRPKVGRALIFDHRILHDSAPVVGTGEKVILRTDIVFSRCD